MEIPIYILSAAFNVTKTKSKDGIAVKIDSCYAELALV